MIDGQFFSDQPVKNNLITYDNICSLDYPYFKNYQKMIAIDLHIQQALHADLKAIQQINFTANLDRGGNKTFLY